MPAAVVVALAALAQAAEATLPAEASVSDGGGGERARGVWGRGNVPCRRPWSATDGAAAAAADGERGRRRTGVVSAASPARPRHPALPPKTRPRQIV